MRPAEMSTIRSLPLFEKMADEHFAELVKPAFLQRFPHGVTLITEGEMPDFLHIVVEGTIELYARHRARETTLDILQPVTTFILAAVIRDEVYLKSARTLAPSRILMIPGPTVRDIFDRDAAFARAIVNELADRYRCLVRSLKNEKLRTSAERLANWILLRADEQGGGAEVALNIEKRTLASRLGMTPENLSRNLAQLAQHGVKSTASGFLLENPESLRRFAHPNALLDQ